MIARETLSVVTVWLNRHWIECLTTDQEAAGSSPAMVEFIDSSSLFCSALLIPAAFGFPSLIPFSLLATLTLSRAVCPQLSKFGRQG